MTVNPGDRIFVTWPRQRGEFGRVVDVPNGQPADEVLVVDQQGSWQRLDGHVWQVDVRNRGEEAVLTTRPDDQKRARKIWAKAGREHAPGYWEGQVERVEEVTVP